MKKSRLSFVLLVFFQMILLAAIFSLYLLQYSAQPLQKAKHLIILGSFSGSIFLNVFIVARMFKVYEKEALFSARGAMAKSFLDLAESIIRISGYIWRKSTVVSRKIDGMILKAHLKVFATKLHF